MRRGSRALPALILCALSGAATAATAAPLVDQWRSLFASATPATDAQLAFENYWSCAFRSTDPADTDTYTYTRMFHRTGAYIWSTDTSSNAPESPDYEYVRIGSELWGSDAILKTTERAIRMTAYTDGSPLLVIERVRTPGDGGYAAAPLAVADARYQAFGYETCDLVLPPPSRPISLPVPYPPPPPPGCRPGPWGCGPG